MSIRLNRLANELNDGFRLFVGVDQTGGTNDQGKTAKPLPVSFLTVDERGRARLKSSDLKGKKLSLVSFGLPSLGAALHQAGLSQWVDALASSKTALLVDCVFGLPKEAWPVSAPPGSETLWNLFARAAQDAPDRTGYGLKPAAKFFSTLLDEATTSMERATIHGLAANTASYPVRECEILARANSVFRTHPFQKNIQCGTYRIWRDLGKSERRWTHIRYFERAHAIDPRKPWLFEAYPSLIWRTKLGVPTRDLSRLDNSIRQACPTLQISKEDLALITKDPDLADAAVLAIGGWLMQKNGELFKCAPKRGANSAKEGWIVGLQRRGGP